MQQKKVDRQNERQKKQNDKQMDRDVDKYDDFRCMTSKKWDKKERENER